MIGYKEHQTTQIWNLLLDNAPDVLFSRKPDLALHRHLTMAHSSPLSTGLPGKTDFTSTGCNHHHPQEHHQLHHIHNTSSTNMEHLSFKLYITENITISGTIIYRPLGPHTIFHDTINLDASNYILLKTRTCNWKTTLPPTQEHLLKTLEFWASPNEKRDLPMLLDTIRVDKPTPVPWTDLA